MTITSIGYAGSIGWAAWAQMARDLGTDYGIDGADDLKVTIKAASAGEVTVSPGTAHGQGIIDTSDATITLAGLTAVNTWYTIVVRRDWTGGPGAEVTKILALAGNATKAIASARKVGAGVVDDQPIALVHRGSTLDQVVDLRCWWGNGGLYAASVDALAYLGRPGSEVRVGSSTFSRRLGATWTELPDTVHADRVTAGTLAVPRIPDLPASKVTSGVLPLGRIPALPASRITTETLHPDRVPGLPASKVATGILHLDRIPNLPASRISSGTLPNARLLNLEGGSTYARLGPPTAITDTAKTGTSVRASSAAGNHYAGFYWGSTQLAGIALLNEKSKTATLGAQGLYDNTSSAGANVNVSSAGILRRTSSSRRYKRDIQDAPLDERLLEVRPRTWLPKTRGQDEADRRYFGAIAEELHDLGLTNLVEYDEQGQPDAIAYPHIAVALIPHVRALADTVAAQAAQITALVAAVEALSGTVTTTTQED